MVSPSFGYNTLRLQLRGTCQLVEIGSIITTSGGDAASQTREDQMNEAHDSHWDEELPDACPPEDAWDPEGRAFFRMVESSPPTDRDFWSHRRIWPDRKFSTSECRARSVSLFERVDDCTKLRKLPLHKDKFVVRVRLPSGSGVLKQTGEYSHHSWWRTKEFEVLSHCEMLEAA